MRKTKENQVNTKQLIHEGVMGKRHRMLVQLHVRPRPKIGRGKGWHRHRGRAGGKTLCVKTPS